MASAEPKPVSGRDAFDRNRVASSNSRAFATRVCTTHSPGDIPVASSKRRMKVRRLIRALAARLEIVRSRSRWRCAQSNTVGERIAFDRRDRLTNVLRLPAFAMRRDDSRRATWLAISVPWSRPHDVQAEVEPRRAPGRGHDVAVVDIEHVGIDLHPRVAA